MGVCAVSDWKCECHPAHFPTWKTALFATAFDTLAERGGNTFEHIWHLVRQRCEASLGAVSCTRSPAAVRSVVRASLGVLHLFQRLLECDQQRTDITSFGVGLSCSCLGFLPYHGMHAIPSGWRWRLWTDWWLVLDYKSEQVASFYNVLHTSLQPFTGHHSRLLGNHVEIQSRKEVGG